MPSARLALREEDVIRLTLEFLDNRQLHISQLSLERETGVINGQFSDDILFLRQLILDGQWDDVIEFIQPLEALQAFDLKKFCYTILRHKYIELLCIKSEAGGALTAAGQGINSMEGAVEEVVQVLEQLEKLAPTKEEYSNLCLLLTFPRLIDHLQYRDWNPSKARVQCFREIYPLVEKYLPYESKTEPMPSARSDRLIQLVIKGVLYESCVSYCQGKATGSPDVLNQDMAFSKLLDGSGGFSDSDLSLLSWLQSIPAETFSVPFEQKTLNVDVERLERPSLETSWTEHMLITPIKPKTFPHSVMPFTRPRSAADIMTRSLIPNLEGLPFGLNAAKLSDTADRASMSRSSFASFHLTGIKANTRSVMASSVDRLFSNDNAQSLTNQHEYEGLPSIHECIQTKSTEENHPPGRIIDVNDNHGDNESPGTTTSTAKSSRRDSLSDRTQMPLPQQVIGPSQPPVSIPKVPPQNTNSEAKLESLSNHSSPKADPNFALRMRGELFEKYQRQKMNRDLPLDSIKTQLGNDHTTTNSDIATDSVTSGSVGPQQPRFEENRRRSIDQLKKIDQIFGGRRESEIIKVTEVEADKKCNVHRRGSRGSSIIEPSHVIAAQRNHLNLDKNRKMFSSAINISNNWNDTVRRASTTSSQGKDMVDSAAAIRRRQSFTEGSGTAGGISNGRSTPNSRKRNSWNPSMFRNIEHPSAFPSLLRSSTPTPTSSSQHNLNQIPKTRVNLTRRASMNSLSHTKQRPIIDFGKRQSHGSQIFLKADSSGETNLVRRDSFGSRNFLHLVKGRATSVPRDYVNNPNAAGGGSSNTTGDKSAQFKQHNGTTKSSILRKSPNEDVTGDRHRLTKDNLNRHVTILENSDHYSDHNKSRKGSNGSIDDTWRARRMSLDSLDIRRASIELIQKDLASLNTNEDDSKVIEVCARKDLREQY